jgi:hypothetical protein
MALQPACADFIMKLGILWAQDVSLNNNLDLETAPHPESSTAEQVQSLIALGRQEKVLSTPSTDRVSRDAPRGEARPAFWDLYPRIG